MFRFNTAVELPLGEESDYINIVPEAGVSVVVEYYTGAAYVADPASPATEPVTIQACATNVRLTPTGGYFAVAGKGVQRALGL